MIAIFTRVPVKEGAYPRAREGGSGRTDSRAFCKQPGNVQGFCPLVHMG
jgi:hypothetical protein